MPNKVKKKLNIKEDLDKTFAKVEQLSTEFNLGDTFYQAGGLRPIGEQYPILAGLVNQLESVTAKITNPSENPDGGLLPPYALENMYEYIEIIDRLVDSVREVLTKEAKGKKTFAIPSTTIMLALLCLFNGKAPKLPRRLLDKPAELRTPEEKQQAREFVNSIIQQDTKVSYTPEGKEIKETSYYAVVADNPKVMAWAGIEGTLFERDPTMSGEALAAAIKTTFGAEGLRHLIAFFIGLEDHGRTGTMDWSVNEHLDRLGKNPNKARRSYEIEDKQRAWEILKIFTSLTLHAHYKPQEKGHIIKLLNWEEIWYEEGFNTNDTVKIKAADAMYNDAFNPPDGKAPMFTHLLRKIATEWHQNHPLTIFMAPLFAIMWRWNPDDDYWKLSVENLMTWCNLDMDSKKKAASYNKLITELQYMTEHGYLGSFDIEQRHEGKYKDMLILNPPDEVKETNKAIADKRALFLPKTPQEKPLTKEEFTEIFKASGLNQKDFGNSLGFSQQTIGFILTGARKPSRKLSDKVREVYPQQG